MMHFNYLIATVAWIFGIASTPGWWKLPAIAFPPYAWYELASKVLERLA